MSSNNLLLCGKCGGSGKYKLTTGECFACRGTGNMASFDNGNITFQGITYSPGMELTFRNSRSNEDPAEILFFYDSKKIYDHAAKDHFPGTGLIELNSIWYELKNKRTGKQTQYPLHGSLDIMGKLQKRKA